MNWNKLDEDWKLRHDSAKFAEMESELDKALYNSVGGAEYALLWRWARMSHFRAMLVFQQGKKEEAARHFGEGAVEAATAVELQPNRVEGHFWRAVCLIESARLRSLPAAARALPAVARHLERAIQIDESYHFAGPLRVQGRTTYLKPRFLGGSVERALGLYRLALEIAPNNSTTLLYYADALIANRQGEAGRRILNQLLEAPVDEEWVWEQARDKKIAAERLARLK